MVEDPGPDLEVLIETINMTKDENLKLVQSLCKKLACEGEEIMFMTVNMSQKTTTCIGSQLGVNFLNHKLFDKEESQNVSQMFQQFLEDHYEISNVVNTIPYSPAGSVVMHSPSYIPFSSPRPFKAVEIPTRSETGKLLTPKVEAIDSEYEGSSTAAESQDESLNSMPSTPKISLQNVNSPIVQNRSVLAGLLTDQNANSPIPTFQSVIDSNVFTRFQSPVQHNALPTFRSPVPQNTQPSFQSPASSNIRALLAKLLSPNGRSPIVPSQNVTSSISFPTPVAMDLGSTESPNVTSTISFPTPVAMDSGSTGSNSPVIAPLQTFQSINNDNSNTDIKKGKRRGKVKRVSSPVNDNNGENSDNDGNVNDQSKTVTLRSGRKVKVPSWRKDILEESLKSNRKKLEEISDVQIKQERISPTFDSLEEESVHVEFDFDLLAELKKESETEADQSEDSSWSGTVLLTSGDDSTPSKVPFKFKFPEKKPAKQVTNDDSDLSSVGLARKPSKAQMKPQAFPSVVTDVVDNKFNYYCMFNLQMKDGTQQYVCKVCQETLKLNEGVKEHCFTHVTFRDEFIICEKCDSVFENQYELQAHVKIHELISKNKCPKCEELFETKLAVIEHLNVVHRELYSCPKCDMVFVNSKGLSVHLSHCFQDVAFQRGGTKFVREEWVSMDADGKLAFKCRSCKDSFDTVEGYNQHMMQHKSRLVLDVNEKAEKNIASEKPTNEAFLKYSRTCHICNKIFETPACLNRHKRNQHGNNKDNNSQESYKCTLCNLDFDSQVDYFNHLTKMHKLNKRIKSIDSSEFQCEKCCRKMLTKEGLEVHQKLHDQSEMKKCDDCGTLLHVEANKLHHCIKNEDSEFKCQECNKCFFSHFFLTGHLNHVHGKSYDELEVKQKGQHFCKICGRVFKKASDLVNHSTMHTGEMPYLCHICHKNFRLRSTLKTHLMTHRDYHEFICEVCGRTFKLVESLRLHRRLHNKACHFKCKHCPREFRAYDGLKYHMVKQHKEHVIGNNLKIYKCEHCGKDMATHQQYIRHVSIHTNEKPLKCDQCDTRWATVSQLNAHKKKHEEGYQKFRCDICKCRFPIMSKLKRHIQTAKHIENCKVRNLPVDTIHLKETSPETESKEQPLQIINNISDLEEKVEIMFYEINLPEEENEFGEKSMIYNLGVDQDNLGIDQDSELYEAANSEGMNTNDASHITVETNSSLLNADAEMSDNRQLENTASDVNMEDDNLKMGLSSVEVGSDCVGEIEMESAS